MIYITRKKRKVPFQRIQFEGRSYRNCNRVDFQLALNLDWAKLYKLDCPELCWEDILKKIDPVVSRTCPIKKRTSRSKGDPWMTNEINEIIHDKDYAWKKARKSNLTEDWDRAKRLRNDIKTIRRKAKADFIQEYIDGDNNDTKKFWKKND